MQDLAMLKEIRVQLMIDEELLKKVEDFRYSNRIPSKSEAIRMLIEKGLESLKASQDTKEDSK